MVWRHVLQIAALLLFVPGGLLVAASQPDQLTVPPVHTPRGVNYDDIIGLQKPVLNSDTVVTADEQDKERIASTLPLKSDGETLTLTVGTGGGRDGLSNVVKLLLLMTVLAVAPGFLMMMTSFTRIIIVMGFVRRALGTQTLPPNQVMLGLSLFLTLFVMAPTFKDLNTKAFQPYMAETISEGEAWDQAQQSVRNFMAKHTRKNDIALFLKIAGEERPDSIDDVSMLTLIPAFVTSELKTAFQMGFIIFLPFIVIDLVIAAVLMALGMMMLPPVMVSLPFKILLFVLVDGWTLLIASLVASYGGG